jgi:hypothetical protein
LKPLRCRGEILAGLLAGVSVAGCSAWDLQPIVVPRNLPRFPASAELDYEPAPCMAHAALPVFDAAQQQFRGPGRIWLKGAPECRMARVGSTTVELTPPWFTALAEAPAGPTTVEFTCRDGTRPAVRVMVPDAAQLNARGELFSALFFGDFQPFAIRDGAVFVNPGDAGPAGQQAALLALRDVFQAAAEGRTARFAAPHLIAGLGDQVYVEGSHSSYSSNHPMSAWTIEAQPRPRVGARDLPRFLDACYRGYWSFTTLQRSLAACPSVMVWDDHDIRDGWGSHGDEHVYRDSHFTTFRDAFVAHQFVRGPRQWSGDLADDAAPLWQAFAIRGVPFFVTDLRTNRDVTVPVVMAGEQWQALRSWFASLDPARCKYYVLVSSVPVFYRVGERANLAAAFSDEIRDDLLDTWTSQPNEAEWLRLVEEIAVAGARGLRGIVVSGDYHLSSLCRVDMTLPGQEPRPVAYELITSGFAQEEYGGWKQKMARKGWFIETPIEAGGASLLCDFGLIDSVPNFGGLEIDGDQVLASIFQSTEAGCCQYRVPLQWEGKVEELGALVTANKAPVEVAPAASR